MTIARGHLFDWLGLVKFLHLPAIGTHGRGSIRTKSYISATEEGRAFEVLCRIAARESNLAMPEFYQGYLTWPKEFAERKDRFRSVLIGLEPVIMRTRPQKVIEAC